MEFHIVVGLNYGDEGKGQVTADLCKKFLEKDHDYNILNVLTNGGSQRGHTVIDSYPDSDLGVDDIFRHVYHHFGSGTLYGIDNCFHEKYILNPMNFVRELKEFSDLGFDISRIDIWRHKDCRWSTPFDMIVNQVIEDNRGNKRHGSVGVGIWETVRRYNLGILNLGFGDFISLKKNEKMDYLIKVRDYFDSVLTSAGCNISENFRETFYGEGLISHFINDCHLMYDITKEFEDWEEIFDPYDRVIFENGQGLKLNSNKKNVHTTPSNTTSLYGTEAVFSGKGYGEIVVHYVTRPYITRHGNGPLYGECAKDEISKLIQPEKTNMANNYQGNFRYAPINPENLFKWVDWDFNNLGNRRPTESYGNNTVHYGIDITHCEENPDMVSKIEDFFWDKTVKSPKYFKRITEHYFDGKVVEKERPKYGEVHAF